MADRGIDGRTMRAILIYKRSYPEESDSLRKAQFIYQFRRVADADCPARQTEVRHQNRLAEEPDFDHMRRQSDGVHVGVIRAGM